jgi:hypothetical protein
MERAPKHDWFKAAIPSIRGTIIIPDADVEGYEPDWGIEVKAT